ncbi:hypothetical protein [Tabrizicola sp.]|uniref:hypothetical protein n=1 Tax=Tabrizicola sp. TaxID=2005166 RepID=UPI0025D73B5B|nr:hypothetical protein [Tabrizicola sp.]
MRTAHDVNIGLMRLLSAPRDVKSSVPYTDKEISAEQAATAYRRLFTSYIGDFAEVYECASETWEADLDELIEGGSTPSAAIQYKLDQCAAGPAEHPYLVWLVRNYWLACDEIGQELPDAEKVRPEVFLLAWLQEDGRREYVQLLTAMPYWPIGLDENGNWC